MRRFKRPRIPVDWNGLKSLLPRGLYLPLGAALFLLSIPVGFYLAPPNDAIRQRLAQELQSRLPVRVEIGEVALRPLLTLVVGRTDISLSQQPEEHFKIDSSRISPRWLGLLSGNSGIVADLRSAGGEVSFGMQESGPFTATAHTLPFDIPLGGEPSIRFAGVLASMDLSTALPLQNTTDSRIEFNLEQLLLRGLDSLLPNATTPLRIGHLDLQATGQGTAFTIEKLTVDGGDIDVSADGTLILSDRKPQNSRINLNLTLRINNSIDPALAELFNLIGTKQQDGSRKLRVTGTLNKPSFK